MCVPVVNSHTVYTVEVKAEAARRFTRCHRGVNDSGKYLPNFVVAVVAPAAYATHHHEEKKKRDKKIKKKNKNTQLSLVTVTHRHAASGTFRYEHDSGRLIQEEPEARWRGFVNRCLRTVLENIRTQIRLFCRTIIICFSILREVSDRFYVHFYFFFYFCEYRQFFLLP